MGGGGIEVIVAVVVVAASSREPVVKMVLCHVSKSDVLSCFGHENEAMVLVVIFLIQ